MPRMLPPVAANPRLPQRRLLLPLLAAAAAAPAATALLRVPGTSSPIAQTALSRAASEGRPLLSCEWESLARRCSTLAADAASGVLLQGLKVDESHPEAAYCRWALEEEVCAKAGTKGRPAVQAALSRFQRMVMQLDRSDGVGATIDPGVFAARYVDLINTCTRTGGAAWTAAVTGIQYAGLDLPSFMPLSEGQGVTAETTKHVDVGALAARCAARLLDHGKLPLDWTHADAARGGVAPPSAAQCRDMMAGIVQVALRLAMLQEEWAADSPADVNHHKFGLAVRVPTSRLPDAPYVPSPSVLELLLKEDLGLSFESETDGDVAVFTVPAAQVGEWAAANTLY